MIPKKILVLCTGNSCRSQMAEGYLKYFAGAKADVFSAGIEAHGVNPLAIESMAQDGIDISQQQSTLIADLLDKDFDFVITVCDNANEKCPLFAGNAIRYHHNFYDPSKEAGNKVQIMVRFAGVREQIKNYCRLFVKNNL